MAIPINCNTLAQVALELQMKFENCNVLNADDLDRLVDLIMAVAECITAGTFNQNNIVTLVELTPYVDVDVQEIQDRVNELPLFTVTDEQIYIFKSLELNKNDLQVEATYIFKPGKGVYGVGSSQVLTENDFILISSTDGEAYIKQEIDQILSTIVSNIVNVGTTTEDGNSLYKGYNTTTDKHEFRRIVSDELVIEEDGDNLVIYNSDTYIDGVTYNPTTQVLTLTRYNSFGSYAPFTVTLPTAQSNYLENNSAELSFIQNRNPTKTVSGSYSVTDSDNNYIIALDNGTSNITVDLSAVTATGNFFVGFMQKGTGLVTFSGYDIKPSTLSDTLLGQGHVASLEIIDSTKYLHGNLTVE